MYVIGVAGRHRHHRRRRGALRGAARRRGRRRGPDRQLRLPRVPDLPPPPGAPRLPGVGPVPRRRPADLPAAAERHRAALRPYQGVGLDPERPVRREDDRRPDADGRGRLPVAGGAGTATWSHDVLGDRRSTTSTASGSSTTPCTRRRADRRHGHGRHDPVAHDPHRQLPRRARSRRCATSRPGSSTASPRRPAPTYEVRRRPGARAGRRPRSAGRPAGRRPDRQRRRAGRRRASARRSTFAAVVEVPPGAGTIVAAEWDFDGSGDYPAAARRGSTVGVDRLVLTGHPHVRPSRAPTSRPCGSTSHRRATSTTPHARIQNLGRVRVVVEPRVTDSPLEHHSQTASPQRNHRRGTRMKLDHTGRATLGSRGRCSPPGCSPPARPQRRRPLTTDAPTATTAARRRHDAADRDDRDPRPRRLDAPRDDDRVDHRAPDDESSTSRSPVTRPASPTTRSRSASPTSTPRR